MPPQNHYKSFCSSLPVLYGSTPAPKAESSRVAVSSILLLPIAWPTCLHRRPRDGCSARSKRILRQIVPVSLFNHSRSSKNSIKSLCVAIIKFGSQPILSVSVTPVTSGIKVLSSYWRCHFSEKESFPPMTSCCAAVCNSPRG